MMKRTILFVFLFLLSWGAATVHASVECGPSKVSEILMDRKAGAISAYVNFPGTVKGPSVMCKLVDKDCKQMYALLLTAYIQNKDIFVTYDVPACSGNITGVIPEFIRIK